MAKPVNLQSLHAISVLFKFLLCQCTNFWLRQFLGIFSGFGNERAIIRRIFWAISPHLPRTQRITADWRIGLPSICEFFFPNLFWNLEFGIWGGLCGPILWTLNNFYAFELTQGHWKFKPVFRPILMFHDWLLIWILGDFFSCVLKWFFLLLFFK